MNRVFRIVTVLFLQFLSAGLARCSPTTAIQALEQTLATEGILLLPGTTNYTNEIDRIWNAASRAMQPLLIVRPVTTAQAAIAIEILAANDIPFGILSGGHTPKYGAQTSSSVLISTSQLNAQVEYPRTGVARIGPALQWGTVYDALDQVNQTAVGGRDFSVGVGGFLLGGGLSHWSSQHGFGADNIVNVEAVLASGKVVNANASSNSDLFSAIKGGGNNFALIASFDVATIEQNGVWGGLLEISSDYIPQVMEALYEWQTEKQAQDLNAALELTLFRGPGLGLPNTTVISLNLFYGAPVSNPSSFSSFLAIPSLSSTLRITTVEDLAVEVDRGSVSGRRNAFYAGTYHSDESLNSASANLFFSNIVNSPLFTDDTSYGALTLQPIGQSLLTRNNTPRALTLDPSGAPYIWYNFAFQYSESSLDSAVLTLSQTTHDGIQSQAAALGKNSDFIFINDAGSDQDPIGSYGSATVAQMKTVRAKYDPKLAFTNLCTGGYKL